MKLFKAKIFSLEMGFSRKEFLTLLESQNKLIYSRRGDVISFKFSGQVVVISVGVEGIRRIGSARIPMLKVSFDFSSMGDIEQEQFMKVFLLKFQRGGG